MKAGRDTGDPETMLAAARLNWRLWTIIQSELLDPASTIPAEIRRNVLSLSRFIDAKTIDFVADPLAPKLDCLIAINRELASGLYANSGAAVAATAETGKEATVEERVAMLSEPAAPASLRLTI